MSHKHTWVQRPLLSGVAQSETYYQCRCGVEDRLFPSPEIKGWPGARYQCSRKEYVAFTESMRDQGSRLNMAESAVYDTGSDRMGR